MHDKKSNHYTSAKNYTDIDGNLRSFDFIDHDVKTSIKASPDHDPEEIKRQVSNYRSMLIDYILNLPASICPGPFQDYVLRNGVSIEWNKKMLSDPGVDILRLRELRTMIENRIELEGLTF